MNWYNNFLLNYGAVVCAYMLEYLESEERYEECQQLENAIILHEKYFNLTLPRTVNEGVLKDYLQAFHRLGLSGNTAMNNLEDYKKRAKAEINFHKTLLENETNNF